MVGMAVAKTPRATLVDVYTKTLGAISAIPQSSPYRQQVEQITTERLELVNNTENVLALEKKINCGQIEEVIIQAKDELSLVEKMSEWQAWDPLESTAPPGQWGF